MALADTFQLTTDERNEIRRSVADSSRPTLTFVILIVLSTLIAGLGLQANSTAVVIGAMLVAPLMGPIFGVAMGIISRGRNLTLGSIFSEILGVVLVVLLGFLIGKMTPSSGLTAEVLSRTQPTILDVGIALFSGFAGAFALCNKRISAALPGVAIATALVPPLASCGICLAADEMRRGAGCFLLFFVNFLAIELAATLVFYMFGLATRTEEKGWRRLFKQVGWNALLLLVMGGFLAKSLFRIIEEQRLLLELQRELTQTTKEMPGVQINDVEFTERDGVCRVTAEFLTPRTIEPPIVSDIEQRLRREVKPNVHLVVRSLISSDNDRSGPVYLTSDEMEKRSAEASSASLSRTVYGAFTKGLANISGSRIISLDMPADDTEPGTVYASISTPRTLSPEDVARLETQIQSESGRPFKLVVRSIPTTEADATQFLNQPEKIDPLDPEMRSRLESILKRRLGTAQPGCRLVSLDARRDAGMLHLRALARTPAVITPEMTAQIENDLRTNVSANIRLVVSSQVEADASASGWQG